MTNVQKYLGVSRLTTEYKGWFFNTSNMRFFKSRIGKILKHSEDEIVFITSEKYNDENFDSRFYSIRVLKRHEGVPHVSNWVDMKFPSSAKAIAYYKKESK